MAPGFLQRENGGHPQERTPQIPQIVPKLVGQWCPTRNKYLQRVTLGYSIEKRSCVLKTRVSHEGLLKQVSQNMHDESGACQ